MNAFADTMFALILSVTYDATTTSKFLRSIPLLHLLMHRWSEHATNLATSFAPDWQKVLFAAKQGIPTQQSS